MEKRRELWIDYLKAVTIFLVIIGHCVDGYLKSNMYPEAKSVFYEIWYFIYSFHMPLFFMISGYTFSLAYLNNGKELKVNRFLRQLLNIFLLYTIWALILWGFKVAIPQYVNTKYGLKDLLYVFLVPMDNYWYLYVLFTSYVIYAVLHRCNKTVLLIASLCVSLSVVILNRYGYINNTLYRILYNFVFFMIGIYAANNKKVIFNKWIVIISVIVSVSILGLHYSIGYHNPILKEINAISMSIIILNLFSRLDGMVSDIMKTCGKNCIYIYLVHPYITAGNRQILPMIGITNPYIALIVNAISALVISYLISVVCNKIWVSDILFRPVNFVEKIKTLKNKEN